MSRPILEAYLIDPAHAEERRIVMGEIIDFLNAERVGAGKPLAGAILVIALDTPYAEV